MTMMMMTVERREQIAGQWQWTHVGRGRSVQSVLRRVYGRRAGYQPDSGVPRHGVLRRMRPARGTVWQASVAGRIRWSEDRRPGR